MDPVGQAGASHRSSAPRVRLTCEACRQRKVKCDKLSPCTSCQRLGVVCVPVERARLPRGRTRKPTERIVGSDKELAERVAKLEKLLKKVASERGTEEQRTPTPAPPPAPARPSASTESLSTQTKQDLATETSKVDADDWQDQNDLLQPHVARPGTAYMGVSFWEDIMQQVS
jgi:hypothetical protein